MDYKFVGVNFAIDDDSGIAELSIYNDSESMYVASGVVVDLYDSNYDASLGEAGSYTWYRKVSPADDTYTVNVVHTGTHNPNAVGPNYNVQVNHYVSQELLTPPKATVTAFMTNSNYPTVNQSYILSDGEHTELVESNSFNGDDITEVFHVGSNLPVNSIKRITKDGGTNWLWPSSYLLSYGSNSPDYDDMLISSSGTVEVNFVDPPVTGVGNVIAEFYPEYDGCKLKTVMTAPTDEADYTDYRTPYRLLDHGIEFID